MAEGPAAAVSVAVPGGREGSKETWSLAGARFVRAFFRPAAGAVDTACRDGSHPLAEHVVPGRGRRFRLRSSSQAPQERPASPWARCVNCAHRPARAGTVSAAFRPDVAFSDRRQVFVLAAGVVRHESLRGGSARGTPCLRPRTGDRASGRGSPCRRPDRPAGHMSTSSDASRLMRVSADSGVALDLPRHPRDRTADARGRPVWPGCIDCGHSTSAAWRYARSRLTPLVARRFVQPLFVRHRVVERAARQQLSVLQLEFAELRPGRRPGPAHPSSHCRPSKSSSISMSSTLPSFQPQPSTYSPWYVALPCSSM